MTYAPGPHGAVLDAAPPAGASRRRRVPGWVWIGATILVLGALGAWLSGSGQWSQRTALDPESAGADGTRAIVQLLREQGVDVEIARTRDDARALLAAADDAGEAATLVTSDSPYLSDDALGALFAAAEDVVLIGPRARSVELLIPAASTGGFGSSDPVAPGCELPEAVRAGTIIVGRTFDTGSSGASDRVTVCYPSGDGYGLLAAPHVGTDNAASGRAVVIDGGDLFTNAHLAEDGNAALGLGLMGGHATLVWYHPSPADSDLANAEATLGDLTPGWVTPAIVLLVVAAAVAALWRGRRFGPLVVERLPVTVRAGETMQGRGRLYARGRDHGHAADSLRIGAVGRLARLLGLGPAADVGTVADAAADRIGASRTHVRALLLDEAPHTDAQLLAISDRLRDLELAVRAAVRDEGRPR